MGAGSRRAENDSERDRECLAECLRLAARARGFTSPNPMVGAVVVRDGEVVGQGYHRRPGNDHAERKALQQAGSAARGATLYANIEPCCHHGRTSPCVEAIVEAGIQRVVASIRDPDRRVNGGGFDALRQAGIQVDVGELADRAARLNESYLTFKCLGRPFVTGKAAVSMDGRIASRTGSSQWITGEAARRKAHRLRAIVDAVIVGVGTVLTDDPRLTARHGGGPGPRYRVVLDSRLRTPVGSRLVQEGDGTVLVFTTSAAPAEARRALAAAGVEVKTIEADDDGRVAWPAVMRELAAMDVMHAMVEGGSRVLTSAFEVGIIDKLVLFYAPLLIGGARALPVWGGEGVDDLSRAPRLRRVRRYRLGDDWAVEGYLNLPDPPQ